MMFAKKLLTTGLTVGLLFSVQTAMAGDHDKLKDWLDDYGFSHVTDVDWKSNDRVEVEGFARDNMRSEVTFDSEGRVHEEEHERYSREAWGLNLDQLQAAMEAGKEAGIRRFDEIDVSSRGSVDVEGYDDNGREVEIRLQLRDL